jgi:hypothetical protein
VERGLGKAMRKVVAVMFMTLDGVAEFPVYPPETGAAADE